MAAISSFPARFPVWRRLRLRQGGVRKLLKPLCFISWIALLSGCATGRGSGLDRDPLLELEEQNARLEAEVTRLRDEKLRLARTADCSAQSSEAAGRAAGEEVSSSLPVVQMEPASSPDELESGEAIVRPAEPVEEEEPIDEDTRPVLKVRGQHEAWVYHRPITAEDRKAKTDPVPVPKE